MKKIILLSFLFLLFISGCSYQETMLNTPTKKVEMFFFKLSNFK